LPKGDISTLLPQGQKGKRAKVAKVRGVKNARAKCRVSSPPLVEE
jgi:hypothetical protein